MFQVHSGFAGFVAGLALLSLSACAIPMAVPTAISAAGGAAYLVKEVLDIDISYRQLNKARGAKENGK